MQARIITVSHGGVVGTAVEGAADGRLRKGQNVPLVEQRWYLTSHPVYFSDTYTSALGNVGGVGYGQE